MKLRFVISESPSGRLVAWNLEGLAAAGSLSWFCTFFLLADLYETFLFLLILVNIVSGGGRSMIVAGLVVLNLLGDLVLDLSFFLFWKD